MLNPSEDAIFDQICESIREAGEITEKHKTRLTELFKGRFLAAYDVVKKRKVRKHIFHPSGRVLYIVEGKEGDYLILTVANYCSCLDFYFRVIDYEIAFCYHLLAQKLADVLETYVLIDESDENFVISMEKMKKAVKPKRLRPSAEIENIRQAAVEILLKYRGVPINILLREIHKVGFKTLTTRHLTNILISDRAKRFRSKDGLWTLSQTQ